MAVDKKIKELALLPSDVLAADIGVTVRGDTNYQFTVQQLLNYLQTALNVGAVVTFGTDAPPADAFGRNGDVYVDTDSQRFYQKVNGSWALKYTVDGSSAGNTVIFDAGAPNNATGVSGDTYIDTTQGKFYKKSLANVWELVFTMASGPAGATGKSVLNGAADPVAQGTDGDFYINTTTLYIFGPKTAGAWGAGTSLTGQPNTILNGSTPPSNDIGRNGDYYINNNTLRIYGPKNAGVWGPGYSLVASGGSISQAFNYNVLDSRFVYDSVQMTLVFTLDDDVQSLFPFDVVNGIMDAVLREKISNHVYKKRSSFDPIITDDGTNYISVTFEGVTDDLINNTQIVLS